MLNLNIQMKIKIKVENKNKYLEIPFSAEEIKEVYDELWHSILYYDEKYKKLSKDKKKTYKILSKFQFKLMHLVHDIIDRGICYRYEAKKRIKEIHYHKKPTWKNVHKGF